VVPIVLVHGNPETDALWDLLAARLAELGYDEPVRLSPPGFGASVPAGFEATAEAYRAWLIGELERLGTPVDLVGHDWGGGHVLGVAITRPDLLRSWCSDALGIFDRSYVWHPLAQIWQKPEAGEEWVAAQLDQSPEQRAAFLSDGGMDAVIAGRVAAGFDESMGACILRLYRSTPQAVLARIGAGLEAAAARPGLAVLATQDGFVGTDEQRRRAAVRADAEVAVLSGLGHWWMTEHDGRAGAQALASFWSSLPA
jgi:pimeloyl-ACP methyl ester carboxylesterase